MDLSKDFLNKYIEKINIEFAKIIIQNIALQTKVEMLETLLNDEINKNKKTE